MAKRNTVLILMVQNGYFNIFAGGIGTDAGSSAQRSGQSQARHSDSGSASTCKITKFNALFQISATPYGITKTGGTLNRHRRCIMD